MLLFVLHTAVYVLYLEFFRCLPMNAMSSGLYLGDEDVNSFSPDTFGELE